MRLEGALHLDTVFTLEFERDNEECLCAPKLKRLVVFLTKLAVSTRFLAITDFKPLADSSLFDLAHGVSAA